MDNLVITYGTLMTNTSKSFCFYCFSFSLFSLTMQCNVITAPDSPHILESIVKMRSRLSDIIEPDFKLLDELLSLTDADIVS